MTRETEPSTEEQKDIPGQVLDLLRTSTIGYLSVSSSKGDLLSYPVAFLFSGLKIYFMTPVSAAKLKFMRANPSVSFIVDNHLLTLNSCGAMIQGKAKVFSIAKTALSILSIGPKMARFAKKYPGMFTFYLRGKELPDERKLYKYRLIRIDPKKLVYWVGYEYGKFFPRKLSDSEDPLSEASDEEKMEAFAQLLRAADEELPIPATPESPEWIENLRTARREGVLSDDEHSVMDSYRNFLRRSSASATVGPEVTAGERRLLEKWKKSREKN